ncbi:ACP S-malonyltransferase [Actinomadura sp. KC216]|uniref:ACP S-malonyltransferase n=1 Tax=Actinomadura sp. KC216 TaxID=2530370 RepID=UPI001046BFD4|nr:ACP S-malonyltransferase [Actinomadura sp. KC216]TDB91180.1 ACP S-malonyltransferase [Actinomadura sp. KC216]
MSALPSATPPTSGAPATAAAVFPGQGSQAPCMGVPWQAHAAWDLVRRAEQQLQRDLSTMLLDPGHPPQGTVDAHMAVVLCSMMAWSTLGPDFTPIAVAGHSLGLVSALYAARVLSAEDTVTVVSTRAEICERACQRTPGGMAAVLASAAIAEAACADTACWVANDNAPTQTVISGTVDGLRLAMTQASLLGARDVIRLDIAGSFHSPLMREAAEEFAERLKAVRFRRASTTIVHNGTSSPPFDSTPWGDHVAVDLVTPVRWLDTQLALAELGANTIVEVGYGRTLTGLAKRSVPGLLLHNASSPRSVAKTARLKSPTPTGQLSRTPNRVGAR